MKNYWLKNANPLRRAQREFRACEVFLINKSGIEFGHKPLSKTYAWDFQAGENVQKVCVRTRCGQLIFEQDLNYTSIGSECLSVDFSNIVFGFEDHVWVGWELFK